MPTIEVDFDVYKAIIARRPSEEVTDNDVLRQMFNLGARKPAAQRAGLPNPDDWIVKGVRLPAGTELRATHKGKTYLARVEGGALALNGKAFGSVSAAAVSITGNPVNGWKFWEVRLPGQPGWRSLDGLRRRE